MCPMPLVMAGHWRRSGHACNAMLAHMEMGCEEGAWVQREDDLHEVGSCRALQQVQHSTFHVHAWWHHRHAWWHHRHEHAASQGHVDCEAISLLEARHLLALTLQSVDHRHNGCVDMCHIGRRNKHQLQLLKVFERSSVAWLRLLARSSRTGRQKYHRCGYEQQCCLAASHSVHKPQYYLHRRYLSTMGVCMRRRTVVENESVDTACRWTA